MSILTTLALTVAAAAGAAEPPINPFPAAPVVETLCRWTFDRDTEGWIAEHECSLATEDGRLVVECSGRDPYLRRAVDCGGGSLAVKLKARCRTAGDGAVYWITDRSSRWGEDKTKHFPLAHDRQWHDYTVHLNAPGRLAGLRIDPGQAPGRVEIDSITLIRQSPHPLGIDRIDVGAHRVRFTIGNHGSTPLEFSALGRRHTLSGGATVDLDRPIAGSSPLEAVSIRLESDGLPPVSRTIFLHHEDAQTDWIDRPLGPFSLRVARDGSVARVLDGGRLVAVIGPLVHRDGQLPALKLVEHGKSLRFEGEGVTLTISTSGQEIRVAIDSDRPCEGPVVRAIGPLEQGLLAGVEYLGKGEKSSSKLDIETAEHLRFAPDPLDVTMPLAAFVTDRASVAMTWSDMTLRPAYATPNFFDLADDHRMALRGKKIEAVIRLDRSGLEEAIRWAVRRRGLPPLREPPRSRKAQEAICLAALEGPLRNENGWGHCVEDRWARRPYAAMASTLWRLTGRIPELPEIVPGGAHVRNGSIYFVTGRARQWLAQQKAAVRNTLRQQKEDGSFRYDGPLRRGHFENTAGGVCARPAATLLEYARYTGDAEALAAGLKTLQYMKRFRTPRGAQVWEVPLHTPDLLASAWLVRAYVRGYELTGKREYLDLARKWALSGVPFVYLWERYPIMLYATPPVFGATQWRHNWIGLPVEWVGGVYAYSLAMLATYDDSLDWKHLARGILISAQQQQYPDGPYVGLLPDSFDIPHQQRRPANINPCALLSLQWALDGRLDGLAVAQEGAHRIVAPFPVSIAGGKARIHARKGIGYQVLIDGERVVEIKSHGEDVVPFP